jgi:outer membrane protein OmpA-like peptidoglycan-associated protein
MAMQLKSSLSVAGGCALALLLSACATTSPESESALDQARAAVERLQAQPLAAQQAGKALQDARDALGNAEAAERAHRPPEEVVHLAYLARRDAEVGEAVLSEAASRDAMAQAQAQRERVLLQARDREAALARQQSLQSQAQAQQAQQQAQDAQQQAQDAQREASDARQQLEAMQAKQTERGLILTLGNVLFDTNGDTLKPGADELMSRLAQFLSNHPDIKARIEGHTDSTGSDDYNQALSQRRADAVANALEGRGVSASQIQAVGRGKSAPVAGNDTSAGRQQNRRVEVIFSDTQGQFASR